MYDSLSADYDRFVNRENRLAFEMPFIEDQLHLVSQGSHSIRILDAACGTGKHALALASHGYQVSGADLSAGMIEKAVSNARTAKIDVVFRKAGFGELSRYYHDFDALLCLGNSLPHISGSSELVETLIDFGTCLRPGGLLLIQNRNFDAVMASQERWMTPESYLSDEGEWLFVRFYDFDQDGLITFHVITLARENGKSWRQEIDHTRLYPILKV